MVFTSKHVLLHSRHHSSMSKHNRLLPNLTRYLGCQQSVQQIAKYMYSNIFKKKKHPRTFKK